MVLGSLNGGLQALTLSVFLLELKSISVLAVKMGFHLGGGGEMWGQGFFLVLTDYLKYISADKIFSF